MSDTRYYPSCSIPEVRDAASKVDTYECGFARNLKVSVGKLGPASNPDVEFFKILGVIALVVVLVFVALVRCLSEGTFPGQSAAIEQLRSDIRYVSCGSNEDVIGQVTGANQNIAAMKAFRARWYGKILFTKKWEGVNLIKIDGGE